MVGYQPEPPLQAIYGLLSLVTLGLTLARPVRQRLPESKTQPQGQATKGQTEKSPKRLGGLSCDGYSSG
jgi:hypothetical protein